LGGSLCLTLVDDREAGLERSVCALSSSLSSVTTSLAAFFVTLFNGALHFASVVALDFDLETSTWSSSSSPSSKITYFFALLFECVFAFDTATLLVFFLVFFVAGASFPNLSTG